MSLPSSSVARVSGTTPKEFLDAVIGGVRWPTAGESPPFWERSARADGQEVALETGDPSSNAMVKDARRKHIVHITGIRSTAPSPLTPLSAPSQLPVHPPHRRPSPSSRPAAEMAPIAKVGGLGDVITGLSRAMMARGNLVEVVLPYYESLDKHAGGPVMTKPILETEFECPKVPQS